jgi:hypothetical protein
MVIEDLIKQLQEISKTNPGVKVFISIDDIDASKYGPVESINVCRLGLNPELLVFIEN